MRGATSVFGFGRGAGAQSYWLTSIYGSSGQGAACTALASDGSLYVGGADVGACYLAKLSPAGLLDYDRRLSTTTGEFLAVVLDAAGNPHALGSSIVGGTLSWIVAKFTAAGAVTWGFDLNQSSTDNPRGLCLDGSGNVYAVGSNTVSSTTGTHVMKLNSSGAIQWQFRRSLGTVNTQADGCVLDAAGTTLYVCARQANGTDACFGLLVYNASTGDLTAQYKFTADDSVQSWPAKAALDPSGSYLYLAGRTLSNPRAVLMKVDTLGSIQWVRKLTDGGNESYLDVACDTAGNVYCVGYTGSGGAKSLIVKYSAAGALQWQRTFGVGINLRSCKVEGGALYITGRQDVGPSGGADAFVAKLPLDGSGLGTYNLGGTSVTYGVATGTDAADAFTSSAGGLLSNNNDFSASSNTTTATPARTVARVSI